MRTTVPCLEIAIAAFVMIVNVAQRWQTPEANKKRKQLHGGGGGGG